MPRLTDNQIQELINAGKGDGGTFRVWLDDKTPYYCWDCKELFYADMTEWAKELKGYSFEAMLPFPFTVFRKKCSKCGAKVSPLAYKWKYESCKENLD